MTKLKTGGFVFPDKRGHKELGNKTHLHLKNPIMIVDVPKTHDCPGECVEKEMTVDVPKSYNCPGEFVKEGTIENAQLNFELLPSQLQLNMTKN